MKDVFSMLQAIAPDLNSMLQTRYQILYQLGVTNHPVGRKLLAERVNLTERAIRTIIQLMKEQGLVEVNHAGIRLTEHGRVVTDLISETRKDSARLYTLEARLKQYLKLEKCWIIPGDLEENSLLYHDFSVMVQKVLERYLKFGKSVIAVTGGETLAHVGEYFSKELSENRELIFVPARGGVGGGFNIQSNIVGGVMAQRTNSKYVPLFIPDTMEANASQVLLSDPSINQAVMMSKQADCLLVSVGSARTMAERRELTEEQQQLLKEQQAIGEVFGVFFNKDGKEVLRLPRIGIQIEEIEQIPLVLTIVGGASKAQAVEGYCQLVQHHGWLICDEGVAKQILNEATH